MRKTITIHVILSRLLIHLQLRPLHRHGRGKKTWDRARQSKSLLSPLRRAKRLSVQTQRNKSSTLPSKLRLHQTKTQKALEPLMLQRQPGNQYAVLHLESLIHQPILLPLLPLNTIFRIRWFSILECFNLILKLTVSLTLTRLVFLFSGKLSARFGV